jgi:hypothetical protein
LTQKVKAAAKAQKSEASTLQEVDEEERVAIGAIKKNQLALVEAEKAETAEKVPARKDEFADKVEAADLEVEIAKIEFFRADQRGKELEQIASEARKLATPDDEEIPVFKNKDEEKAERLILKKKIKVSQEALNDAAEATEETFQTAKGKFEKQSEKIDAEFKFNLAKLEQK